MMQLLSDLGFPESGQTLEAIRYVLQKRIKRSQIEPLKQSLYCPHHSQVCNEELRSRNGYVFKCKETERVVQRQWLQAYLHKHPNTCYVTTLASGPRPVLLQPFSTRVERERCQISYVKEHFQCPFSAH